MDTLSGIGVLDKTMAILRATAAEPAGLGALVQRTGISRATTHRLAQGMEAVGLLRRTAEGAYAPGPALIGLGRAAVGAYPLAALALPVLRQLRDDTGESAQFFVADGDQRLCVASADSVNELRTIVAVGARLPMDRGSAGRALVDEVGPDGWCASVAERAPGVASVSAPVRDGDRIVGAVSLSGPIERLTDEPGARFGPLVVDAARTIERTSG
ncbi:MAG: IclR family transcriptional regulator [Acidimicrobiales bacterium]|nr:IclR family transcriptional regulator [Acidimicrobiales bacterium]